MRQRWRSIVRPEADEANASPNTGEALGVWLLGILWALVCLWLGYLGSHWVLPGVLLAGLLALWGWRHMEWLWWFPVVLVVATLLEPLSPLPMRSRFGPLVYVDLLTIGVALVAVVRAVGLRQPLLPRTPIDRLVIAIFALFAIGMVLPGNEGRAILDFKQFVVRVVVFYATTTIASRPLGSRWVWTAFPLACALIGLHALWAKSQGAEVLTLNVTTADLVWGSQHGVFNTLLVALPVSAGLALCAGKPAARWTWMVAALVGAVGLGLHLSRTAVGHEVFPAARWTPFEICRTAVALVVLAVMARLSWKVRAGRMHEGPRWLALSLTFAMFAVVELIGSALSGPAVPLLSVAAGLVVGTLRADRRAIRSGRVIGPVVTMRKAA